MPDFCCRMLDERGHMLFPADINAENLETAIRHTSDILRTSNQSLSARRVYSFEIWSGTSRLFPPERQILGQIIRSASFGRVWGYRGMRMVDGSNARKLSRSAELCRTYARSDDQVHRVLTGHAVLLDAGFYRTYAKLFQDDQVRQALTEYAALLEARADRTG